MAMTRTQRTQLSAFIQRKRRVRRERARAARRTVREGESATSPGLAYAPIGFWFSPRRHGLTIEQCRLATALLRRRNRASPIRGTSKQAQCRRALRIAGIVSAVRGGRVGNARWGRSMGATKGSNAMRDHALQHLRAIAPLGRQAAQAKREGRRAQKVWDRQQRQPETYEAWQQAIAAWPVEQYPKDFMSY